ncbi:hypothetical protein ACFL5G_01020 [Candidatus Margulisiibacteriota bacterium]
MYKKIIESIKEMPRRRYLINPLFFNYNKLENYLKGIAQMYPELIKNLNNLLGFNVQKMNITEARRNIVEMFKRRMDMDPSHIIKYDIPKVAKYEELFKKYPGRAIPISIVHDNKGEIKIITPRSKNILTMDGDLDQHMGLHMLVESFQRNESQEDAVKEKIIKIFAKRSDWLELVKKIDIKKIEVIFSKDYTSYTKAFLKRIASEEKRVFFNNSEEYFDTHGFNYLDIASGNTYLLAVNKDMYRLVFMAKRYRDYYIKQKYTVNSLKRFKKS